MISSYILGISGNPVLTKTQLHKEIASMKSNRAKNQTLYYKTKHNVFKYMKSQFALLAKLQACATSLKALQQTIYSAMYVCVLKKLA